MDDILGVDSALKNVMERFCPICQGKIIYKNKHKFNNALQNNKMCHSCAGRRAGIAKRGSKATLETKMKISIAQMGRRVSKETRARQSARAKGRRKTDEHKDKIRNTLLGHIVSPETKRKISKTKRDNPKPGSRLGAVTSYEVREKQRLAKIRYYEKHPDKIPYLLYHHYLAGESYPEKKFREYLESCGLVKGQDFIQEHRVSVYSIDFAFPIQNIAIEIDGILHKKDKNMLHDAKRDQYLEDNGWKVFRIAVNKIFYQLLDGGQ